jgi:hypothetical protein
MKKLLTLVFFLILLVPKTFSQTISVGSYAESIARMNQLLGITDDLSSFTQHPLNSAFNAKGDSALQNMVASKNLLPHFKLFGIPSSIKILPFTWLNDYNSKLPFGYNNGPLYPNVGYQTEITGGIFIKAGILNIQFKPELVHAENSPFLTFADVQANYNSGLIKPFYKLINGIDAPERFGPFGLSYAGLGQSKITFQFKNIEAGVSTENMWWGPGVQNSIMMSNSAPGFLHWTFNSVNPAKTAIGSFEWQLIGGILKQSGYTPYDPGKLVYGNDNLYLPKPKVTRYISAFTANWQPKWIPGFFIGISGYDYMNRDSSYSERSILKKIIPVFSPSSNEQNSFRDPNEPGSTSGDGEDFAYAINFRQVFPQYNAEIYFEYAKNDNVANFRDLIIEPEQATGYTFGAGRLFKLKGVPFLQLRMELTHLQIPDNFLVRPEGSWYVHGFANPRDGYTNEGRYLGAGIGPGSNSLMFDISYVKGLNSFGIKFERFVHDNDLYYLAFMGTNNFVSNWVDFSNTFYANMKFKKYLISAEYTPISSLNYEYLQHNDISNKHARITLTYFFD